MEKKDSDLISITGLWENIDKNGNTYYTGSFGHCLVSVFKNRSKIKDNHPDYVLYFSKKTINKATVSNEANDHVELPF